MNTYHISGDAVNYCPDLGMRKPNAEADERDEGQLQIQTTAVGNELR